MKKYKISDKTLLDKVKQWIELDGIIYFDIYFVHAGATAANLLIASYKDFIECLPHGGKGEITVVRHPDYLLNGMATVELLEQALKMFQEENEWKMVILNPDDVFNPGMVRGRTHKELSDAFKKFNTMYIAICFGRDQFPPDRPPKGQEEVLVADFG